MVKACSATTDRLKERDPHLLDKRIGMRQIDPELWRLIPSLQVVGGKTTTRIVNGDR